MRSASTDIWRSFWRAVPLAIGVIALGYIKGIEHFPDGGGGYLVASKELGPHAGLVSGAALLVDYVLTIAVSLSSGGDAIFSFLPPEWHAAKVPVVLFLLVLLTFMNLRGVRESILVLTPIFLLFLIAHAVLIFGVIGSHAGDVAPVAASITRDLNHDLSTIGPWAVLAIFLRAFALGGGTFTGIEAVSNGLGLMREPRVRTARRTMFLVLLSLSAMAGGILVCYLLLGIQPQEGKTMNAVLAETFVQDFGGHVAGWGTAFVVVILLTEAGLLFVAAQAGFVSGPKVMANMAVDRWVPTRFAALSEQLTMRNGVTLMSILAAIVLIYTQGDTHTLVVMYSINVFLTFAMSNLGMVKFTWKRSRQGEARKPKRALFLHSLALVICLTILAVTVVEKFGQGGWLTLLVTGSVVVLCTQIRRHYVGIHRKLTQLADSLDLGELPAPAQLPAQMDPNKPTAVVLADRFSGLGVSTLLKIPRIFPGQYEQVVFISVGVLDAASAQNSAEVDRIKGQVQENLDRYVHFARTRLGWASDSDFYVGTEAVGELERLCREVHLRFPRSVFFAGKVVFHQESWMDRLLHNETAHAVQRRLEFDGLPMVVLPTRVMR